MLVHLLKLFRVLDNRDRIYWPKEFPELDILGLNGTTISYKEFFIVPGLAETCFSLAAAKILTVALFTDFFKF